MKRFRFPNKIGKVIIPFLLSDHSSWQEQVEQEMKKTQERVGTNKRARWGYKIENGSAEIYISKF